MFNLLIAAGVSCTTGTIFHKIIKNVNILEFRDFHILHLESPFSEPPVLSILKGKENLVINKRLFSEPPSLYLLVNDSHGFLSYYFQGHRFSR